MGSIIKLVFSGGILGILIALLSVIGWIANVIQVVHTLTAPITGLFIIKCVGILFFPLGIILGWMGIL